MKTHRYLWNQIVAPENLFAAAAKAAKGKRSRPDVASFLWDLEAEVFALHHELEEGSYQHGPYREFHVYERKPRVISAAPFRDRVVHHALCNVIQPIFERGLIEDSYACREGKGTHKAVARFEQFQRRFRYVLKCDVARFFESVDHGVLKALLRRWIACRRTLDLCDTIISSKPKGLPIGNLTSQFWANVYLDPLDQFIKQELRARGYLRYCDDFVLFSDSREQLWRWLAEAEARLEALRLGVNWHVTRLCRSTEAVSFLGFRCTRGSRRLTRPTVMRAKRRWRHMRVSGGAVDSRRASLVSWLGHAKWAATERLLVGLGREMGRALAGGSPGAGAGGGPGAD